MQPTNPPGLYEYSDFFASGFRATPGSRSQSHARSQSVNDAVGSLLFPVSKNLSKSTSRHVHPSLLIKSSSDQPTSSHSNSSTAKQAKRSSFVSLTRIFEGASLFSSRRTSRVVPEKWVVAGGENTPSAPNGSSAFVPLDPFSASPDARSMFIDLELTPEGSPVSRAPSSPAAPAGGIRESFLSLTGSYPTQSLLFAPGSPSGSQKDKDASSQNKDTPTQDTFPSFLSIAPSSRSSLLFPFSGGKRPRPTSVQTMPLPARSRRSSISVYLTQRSTDENERGREREKERVEPALIIEEELPMRDDRAAGEWDAPAKIDWHQFHIDILSDESSSPPT